MTSKRSFSRPGSSKLDSSRLFVMAVFSTLVD